MTLGAFPVVIALQPGLDRGRSRRLDRLGAPKPFLCWLMLIFVLSLAGIPPTAGFWESITCSNHWWRPDITFWIRLELYIWWFRVSYYFRLVRFDVSQRSIRDGSLGGKPDYALPLA